MGDLNGTKISSVTDVVAVLRCMQDLQQLTLNFKFCHCLKDVAGLGGILRNLHGLQQLWLDLRYCIEIPMNQLDELRNEVQSLQQFEVEEIPSVSGFQGFLWIGKPKE